MQRGEMRGVSGQDSTDNLSFERRELHQHQTGPEAMGSRTHAGQPEGAANPQLDSCTPQSRTDEQLTALQCPKGGPSYARRGFQVDHLKPAQWVANRFGGGGGAGHEATECSSVHQGTAIQPESAVAMGQYATYTGKPLAQPLKTTHPHQQHNLQ